MASEGGWPSSLRSIGKYLARASEIEADEPIVAYYCTLYSLKTAFRIRDKSDPNASKLVTSLLEKCESESAKVGSDQEEHKKIVLNYALKIFRGADDEDRAGNATLETAKTFYSAMCFLEVFQNFGKLDEGLLEKLRYAKYKVATITKAVREGRRPEPGPPEGREPTPTASGSTEMNPKLQPTEGPAIERPLHPKVEESEPEVPNGTNSSFYSHLPHQESSETQSSINPASEMHEPSNLPHTSSGMPTSYLPQSKKETENDDFHVLSGYGSKYPPNPPEYPSQDAPSPLNSYTSPYESNVHSSLPPSAPAPPSNATPKAPPTAPTVPPTAPTAPPTAPTVSSSPSKDLYPSTQSQHSYSLNTAKTRVAVAPAAPKTAAAPPAAAAHQFDLNYRPGAAQISKAQQMAKNAVSALDFQDMKTAVGELEKALALLTGQNR